MSEGKYQSRSVARLSAVQALYQMETAGAGVEAVIREFTDHRFDRDIESDEGEGEQLAQADEDYFATIVRGAVERQGEIDKAIAKRLAANWKLERIDATLRAIFRAGGFELLSHSAPREIVIDEYVEIAKSFFEGPEPGFVNGALDAMAKDVGA